MLITVVVSFQTVKSVSEWTSVDVTENTFQNQTCDIKSVLNKKSFKYYPASSQEDSFGLQQDPGCHVTERKSLCGKEINIHRALIFHLTRIFAVDRGCINTDWKSKKHFQQKLPSRNLEYFLVLPHAFSYLHFAAVQQTLMRDFMFIPIT